MHLLHLLEPLRRSSGDRDAVHDVLAILLPSNAGGMVNASVPMFKTRCDTATLTLPLLCKRKRAKVL